MFSAPHAAPPRHPSGVLGMLAQGDGHTLGVPWASVGGKTCADGSTWSGVGKSMAKRHGKPRGRNATGRLASRPSGPSSTKPRGTPGPMSHRELLHAMLVARPSRRRAAEMVARHGFSYACGLAPPGEGRSRDGCSGWHCLWFSAWLGTSCHTTSTPVGCLWLGMLTQGDGHTLGVPWATVGSMTCEK